MTDVERVNASATARAAAVMSVALGAGFGVGSAVTLVYLASEGELPMSPFGFRLMAGPAEALGPTWFMVLGWTLVGVCAVDVVAGVWLWQGRRRGADLEILTAIPALALGAAFALPFLLIGVPIRTALAVVARRGLR